MVRFASHLNAFLTLTILLATTGCGSATTDVAETASVPNVSTSQAVSEPDPPSSPTDIVSQFLDRIRRGGQDSSAGALLTKMAQSELLRIGRTVEPIGSPDARYRVTRAETVPDNPNSCLVHSVWTEPGSDGSTTDFEVVWELKKESAQWRISGMAMQVDPNELPMIIDFENGQRMATLFGDATDSSGLAR